MSDVHWEDPPGKHGRPERYVPLVEQLKAHPGKWARVLETHKDSASGIRTWLKMRYGLEVTQRTENGQIVLLGTVAGMTLAETLRAIAEELELQAAQLTDRAGFVRRLADKLDEDEARLWEVLR